MDDPNKNVPQEKDKSVGKKKSRFDIKGTLQAYKAEYKKIIWPKRDELIKSTITVVITCTIFGIIICGMDALFQYAYSAFQNLL